MYDLNSLLSTGLPGGGYLFNAVAINDNGWILANGPGRSYLLQPVPEPGSAILAGCALGAILALAVRRN